MGNPNLLAKLLGILLFVRRKKIGRKIQRVLRLPLGDHIPLINIQVLQHNSRAAGNAE